MTQSCKNTSMYRLSDDLCFETIHADCYSRKVHSAPCLRCKPEPQPLYLQKISPLPLSPRRIVPKVKKKETNTKPKLKEIQQSRPPLIGDFDTPVPGTYSPRNDPISMDNSPRYTFRPKPRLDSVGGYTHVWLQKPDFESEECWPSAAEYNTNLNGVVSCLDRSQYPHSPVHSIGIKGEFILTRKGVENEPAPNKYYLSKGQVIILSSYFLSIIDGVKNIMDFLFRQDYIL